jgi:hypothetical protein
VQFGDAEEKDVNGQIVTEFTIRAVGSQKLVKVSVWPEFAEALAETPIKQGDFVAADGKFTQSLGQAADGSPREYFNLTAYALIITKGAKKVDTRGVTQKSAAKADDAPLF